MLKAPTAVQTKAQFVKKAEEIRSGRPMNQNDINKEFQVLLLTANGRWLRKVKIVSNYDSMYTCYVQYSLNV
jgi:hypothetical protein